MKKIFFPLLVIIFIPGCKQSGQKMEESADMAGVRPAETMEQVDNASAEMNPAASPQTGPSQSFMQPTVVQKKIIRDGSMTLKVVDLIAMKKQVDSIVSAFGGYIGSESFNSYEQESSYILTIRVPAVQFDRLIERLERGTGEVVFKDINARDVTEEYIDLETRLASKHKFIDRYTELLKKAASVKDMLEIEENIRKIEEEIESTE
jgi:hypothetical protein